MASFNKVILIGNCVRDLELRYIPSGTAVTDISLAVNSTFGSGDNRKEETLFISITAWGKQAETLSRYLQKGDPILIEGRLVLDQWTVGEEKRSKIKVVLEKFQFLSGRSSGRNPSVSTQQGQDQRSSGPVNKNRGYDQPTIDEDEVPF